MPDLSPQEAREFIATVREDNGGISPDDREFLETHRPRLLVSIRNNRKRLAASITTVFKNLYSKETRFLYELIQNAEDNSYSIATADSSEPYLAFKLYSDRIIVDSNEDGFTKENIAAICSIGDSTKNQSAGYIGEKGIGFKSVFKVAKKVHIQSGPFSFAFSHTRDDKDDGLGLITPYDEEAEELPVDVRTRMTLTLIDPSRYEDRASELQDLPDTFLMFLTRLKRLSIHLYQSDKTPTIIQYSKREKKEKGFFVTFLTKKTRKDTGDSTLERKYYTMKRDIHHLPFDELRVDKKENSIDQATAILAFPVDEHDEPTLEEQYTYAFLPLQPEGFKFLIQADFVTQASREGVEVSSRNKAVLAGVADAFTNAMVGFCKHPILRYKWMRYLPEDFITHEFWGSLRTQVLEKLRRTPLLEPWSGNGLYEPPALQRLTGKTIANDGSPLLQDLEGEEIYLSPKYTEEDFQILKRLGTDLIWWSKLNDRLAADLCLTQGSRWKNMIIDADWRTRICNCLSGCFDHEDLLVEQNRLRSFSLIPMLDGEWKSCSCTTKLFFPENDNIPIPADLGLGLVRPTAIKNDAWVQLLKILGVVGCPPDSVISSIYKRYDTANFDNFTVSNGVAHMKYLYWFLPKDKSKPAPQVRLANQYHSLMKKEQYLYFPDGEDDYSPSKLFKPDLHLTGHPVNYMHESYLTAVDSDVIRNGSPWKSWLQEKVGVRSIAELLAQGGRGLSKEFKYIIDHRSNRLLGTLKHGWRHYHLQINDDIMGELGNSPILLENGRRESLQHVFLPLPKLKNIAKQLRIADGFPFIAMAEPLRDEERNDWTFVKDLGVGIDEDLQFYLSALDVFKTLNFVLNAPSARDQLAKIYENIQMRCAQGIEHVQDIFKNPFIMAPPSIEGNATWLSSGDCVWEGPLWLKSKHRLKLEPYLRFEHLFKVVLKIPDAAQIDAINDLLMLKRRSEDKGASKGLIRIHDRLSFGSIGEDFQFNIPVTDSEPSTRLQCITSMEICENESFEEVRLTDYEFVKPPLKAAISTNCSKDFVGFELDKITDEAEKRYDYLWLKKIFFLGDENSEGFLKLQETFERSALVYVPKENSWYRPSQCVWIESSVKISSKASIADAYPSKKTFFKDFLKVSEPTIEMYVHSLIVGAEGKASVEQIKETMALICGLEIGETNLSSLVEAKFLPVKLRLGSSGFASASSKSEPLEFAIVENISHWNAFKGKIAILDFTLEEIRDTRPLLLALGLERLFSSKLVREVTDVSGGSEDHEMTRKIRTKSEAIVRFALHFATMNERQDTSSLYRKLKRAIVYVSDSIRLSMQITQNGDSIEGTSSRANFHLEETRGTLRLYLPKDEVERDVCFESDLPRRLCKFLNIADPGAPAVIGGVFRKDNPAVIDRILKNVGIGQVDCDFVALDKELGVSEVESNNEVLVNTNQNITLSTSTTSPRPHETSSWSRWTERQSGRATTEASSDISILRPSHEEQQIIAQEAAYKRVLENAVNVARERAQSNIFESDGVSTRVPATNESLPQNVIKIAFPTPPLIRNQERDTKVGAAGELYMFEYLQGLNLPGFDRKCWKSSIRDRVKIHPTYHDIEKDNDREAIADIEYNDVSSKLTRFLTRHGYLAPKVWDSEKPYYHIEVKTTTASNWQEPFFMSQAQERHIQDKRIEDGGSRSSIYIICRVFNLGKGDETGLHIYLDPETKRRNGELEFIPNNWSVKPLTHRDISLGKGIAGTSAAQTTDEVETTAETDNNILSSDARDDSIAAGPSTLGSQKRPESVKAKPVEVKPGPSGTETSAQLPPKSGLFGSRIPKLTENLSSGINTASSSSDNPRTPSPGTIGSNGTTKASPFGPTASSVSSTVSPDSNASRSPSQNLFGSTTITPGNRSPSPMRNLFDFTSDSTPPNRDAPKSPSSSIFGSNTNSSDSKSGDIFSSNSQSSSGHTPRARSTGSIFGVPANNDAAKGASPRSSGSFGLSPRINVAKATEVGLFDPPTKDDITRDRPLNGSVSFGLGSSGRSISPTPRARSVLGRKMASPKGRAVVRDSQPSSSKGSSSISSSSSTFEAASTDALVGTARISPNTKNFLTPSSSDISSTKASPANVESFIPGPPTFSFGTSPFPSPSSDTPKTASAEGLADTSGETLDDGKSQTPRARSPFGTNSATSNSNALSSAPSSTPPKPPNSPVSPTDARALERTRSPSAKADSTAGAPSGQARDNPSTSAESVASPSATSEKILPSKRALEWDKDTPRSANDYH